MALLHQAELTPPKRDVLQAWVPSQPWLGALDPAGLRPLGSYRFDDPAGQVGLETMLLATDAGAVLQVPLTYRPEPLDGVAPIATLQHSVLGPRWVYDGTSDPVYLQVLVSVIVTGGEQAELMVATDSGLQRREPSAVVRGSGRPGTAVPEVRFGPAEVRGRGTVLTTVPTGAGAGAGVGSGSGSGAGSGPGSGGVDSRGGVELTVLHVLDPVPVATPRPGLSGSWPGQDGPIQLVLISGV